MLLMLLNLIFQLVSIEETLKSAVEEIGNENYTEAKEAIYEILPGVSAASDSLKFEIYSNFSKCLIRLGERDSAYYYDGLAFRINSLPIKRRAMSRAYIYYYSERRKESVQVLENAIALNADLLMDEDFLYEYARSLEKSKSYERSIEIYRICQKIYYSKGLSESVGYAKVIEHLGILKYYINDFDSAIYYFDKAANLFIKTGMVKEFGSQKINKCAALIYLKKYSESIQSANESISILERYFKSPHPSLTEAYSFLATALLLKGQYTEAIIAQQAVLKSNSKTFRDNNIYTYPEIKDYVDPYNQIFAVWRKSNIFEKMGNLSMTRTAFHYGDSLITHLISEGDFLKKYTQWKGLIDQFYVNAVRCSVANQWLEEAYYFDEKNKLLALSAINGENPIDFFNRCYENLDKVRRRMGNDEIVLSYSYAEYGIELFEKKLNILALTNDSVFAVSVKYNNLKEIVHQNDSDSLAKQIGLESITLADKKIIIIPYGVISEVSFDGIIVNGKHLLHHNAVSFNYSVSMIAKKGIGKNSNNRSMIIGPRYNSLPGEYDTTSIKFTSFLVRSGKFDLPGALYEAKSVHGMINSELVQSEKELVEMDTLNVLHIAAHSISDKSDLSKSYILLEPNESSDGYLFGSEIKSWGLRSKLVVLSTCFSADITDTSDPFVLREKHMANGIQQNLATIFYLNGSDAVLASKWQLPDETTPYIIENFYIYLKAGVRKDEALRLAKIKYLDNQDDPVKRHPYFWAGFVLIGNSDPIELSDHQSFFPSMFFLVSVTILALLLRLFRRLFLKNRV